MAKKHKLSPVGLFAISAGLLCAGWLMRSFPLFIFAGLAPLFAIMDHALNESRFWNLAELILAALAVGLFAAHALELEFLVISLVEAIALSLAFVGYSFVHQRLGSSMGKFIIIIFWLAIEYVFLRLPWRNQLIFLGDSLALMTDWLKWTQYTGYLGASVWILITNLLLYQSFFRGEKISWPFLVVALLSIAGPVIFSYRSGERPISRTDMIARVEHKNILANQNYIRLGEVIPTTAAGLTALIVLAALTRNKDRN